MTVCSCNCCTQYTCVLCALGWVSWDHGIDFMNNRSRLPPEGSAKGEHLYGIKARERARESLKVGGEGKGGLFWHCARIGVLESTATQTSQSITLAGHAYQS